MRGGLIEWVEPIEWDEVIEGSDLIERVPVHAHVHAHDLQLMLEPVEIQPLTAISVTTPIVD